MSPEALKLTSKALSLIELSRYRMGTSRFVEAFIDQWAYLQTGLYPSKEEIPKELQPVAFELSHVLSAAMKRDPTSDVLGYVLSMSGFHKKGTNYFPTPPEIGRLLSLITGAQSSADFYEPCCGSGINAIHWMENLIDNKGPKALTKASIYLEDIDPLMVKSCMLQLFHYFESRNTTPKKLSIVGIDTLSRQTKNIAYYAEKPPASVAAVAA
ncbi:MULTISPECIES: restriction endonuclease subunit M [Gammaproteobacteria]|uniref:restriction endonuclease subunit M n=2 Tax=Pseudomonadota TaxID=1224 RepID=UPI001077486A|nr:MULTISPECIES: restriction endonuclease subunit M [Gammaproteobacteria]EAB9607387.1 restriction endonuclease subunit M [Salmonella enterica subsp. enterica serovar Infantis]HAK2687708.1 restriction endonuclease subunit M [Salmonella enterica]EFB1672089.1 restriction endonuclease subunit M [Escherichia coli]EFF6323011.1 restriction endonuclease subunit M [Escherichia coli]EGK3607938.1 restriction endonuclease subunit M [Escherichia coli]